MDAYHTVAEIAAALLGFAGIVVAIAASRPSSGSDIATWSTRTLPGIFLPGLSAILFAYLPDLLFGGRPENVVQWRVACGVFGMVHLVESMSPIWLNRASGEAVRSGLVWIISVSQLAIWPKIVVALGWFTEFAYQVYLLGLLWYLVIMVGSFLNFVQRIGDPR